MTVGVPAGDGDQAGEHDDDGGVPPAVERREHDQRRIADDRPEDRHHGPQPDPDREHGRAREAEHRCDRESDEPTDRRQGEETANLAGARSHTIADGSRPPPGVITAEHDPRQLRAVDERVQHQHDHQQGLEAEAGAISGVRAAEDDL